MPLRAGFLPMRNLYRLQSENWHSRTSATLNVEQSRHLARMAFKTDFAPLGFLPNRKGCDGQSSAGQSWTSFAEPLQHERQSLRIACKGVRCLLAISGFLCGFCDFGNRKVFRLQEPFNQHFSLVFNRPADVGLITVFSKCPMMPVTYN